MPPPCRPALPSSPRWPQPGGFERAAVYGRHPRRNATLIDPSRKCRAPCRRQRRRIRRCLKSAARTSPILASGPFRSPLCARGEVAVSAVTPQHAPPSLCLVNASQLADRDRGVVAPKRFIT
jgi:hypothetical protein